MSKFAEIDSEELTLRIAEACLGLKRPQGMTATQALDHLSGLPGARTPFDGFTRAAHAVCAYMAEQINGVRPGQAQFVAGSPTKSKAN